MTAGSSKAVAIALYVNAAVLAVIALKWFSQSGTAVLPAAFAQQPPQPIAGGGGLFLMPGQLSTSTWGCYVMDVDRQTLMVYQYLPGDRILRLMAGREFAYDRRLRKYNTDPPPEDIKSLTDKETDRARQANPQQ